MFNDQAKLGFPFRVNKGYVAGVNNTGAAVTKGQGAVVDITNTDGTTTKIVCATTANAYYPACIAASDIASSASGYWFVGPGKISALLDSTVTSTATSLGVGTANSTGGNVLIASNTTNRNSCAMTMSETYQSTTTLSPVLFDGSKPWTLKV